MNLEVSIGKLKLFNPVMVASGTFGKEYGKFFDINLLGAYVAKTVTLKARIGNPPPRVTETFAGMLNSIGLENKGVDDFIENKLQELSGLKIPIVASVAGDNENEYAALCKKLDGCRKVRAIELNLSCPNVRHGERIGLIAQDEKAVYGIVKKARGSTDKTLIAKLSPNVTDITVIALAAERAGCDAVSLINTFPALAVDTQTFRPMLGNVIGGLSGPAIKPIALKMVRDVCNKVRIPVVGIGGITDYKDALEFMICGATAFQVGTANFINPEAPIEILKEIKSYLKRKNIESIKKIIGSLEI
ncbi:MAG: dihydroorotate dehydrogenase [Candidatus Omnitrophica bacterium]|nr:dihydroorotate dehydrogenase [Candidatus Omnitrophota bacterium]